MMNAIMIKTKDKRKFFTFQKNLPLLIELIKSFNLEITALKVNDENNLLELETFISKFCDANYTAPKIDYDILYQIYPKIGKIDEIKNFIYNNLLEKKEISLIELKLIYPEMCNTNLSTYYSQVRKRLKEEGYVTIKTGVGKYKLKEEI